MRRAADVFVSLICAAGLALAAAPAHAGTITLRIMLWGSQNDMPRRPEEPLVARYQPDHGASFVLDRSVNPPLLRFEDSSEVWILQAQPGPGGDTIFRNDVGQPVLRATKLGGLTLFTEDDPTGAAVAYDGEALSLKPSSFMPPGLFLQRVLQASARSSHAAQRMIPFFTIDDATPETAPLVADTAGTTAEAITRVSHQTNGRTLLARIVKVMLAKGGKPDARLDGGALIVTYTPGRTIGLHPSSERIMRAIGR